MPVTPVTVQQYPDVPVAKGVPAIFRDPTKPVFTALILIADIVTIARAFQGPQWGIFTKEGAAAVVPDTIVSLDFRRESRLSDYPTEQGGFETFNKVATPYDIRVRLGSDGGLIPKSLFLAQIDFAAQSLDTYIVATPDVVYPNVNIMHYDYRRTRDNGLGVLQVDMWLQEIRSTVRTTFTNTKEPTSEANTTTGTVQPQEPTPTQAAALPKSTKGKTSLLRTVGPDDATSVLGLA